MLGRDVKLLSVHVNGNNFSECTCTVCTLDTFSTHMGKVIMKDQIFKQLGKHVNHNSEEKLQQNVQMFVQGLGNCQHVDMASRSLSKEKSINDGVFLGMAVDGILHSPKKC